MKIGAMNHPAIDAAAEIRRFADLEMEFVDLTLEPPKAAPWDIDVARVAAALRDTKLSIVGHTAYYLPLGSPIEELRRAAVSMFRACLAIFADLGAPYMNIHPDYFAPFHERAFSIRRNLQSIEELLPEAATRGIGLMVENLPGSFNTAAQLGELLDPLPELGLHLDLGHTNLMVQQNSAAAILASYAKRIRHVHLHDNKGGTADLHLPLGAGNLDTVRHVQALKAAGYDGTITLEVFSHDSHYLAYSRDVLRKTWDAA
jgi:sugar phosphate isomerase/epimerase